LPEPTAFLRSIADGDIPHCNKGITKYNLKDYSGSIIDFTKAIEINPEYAEAYYNRGISKDDIQDYLGAIADYTKAIKHINATK
jgi:tetratricopeptide (TPR) repeat protein